VRRGAALAGRGVAQVSALVVRGVVRRARRAQPNTLAQNVRERRQEEGDPARTAVLYECAVAAFPVTAYLWAAYGRMVEERLRGVPAVVSAVYARAARNCPWVGLLWARRAPPPRAAAPSPWGPTAAARRPRAAGAQNSRRRPTMADVRSGRQAAAARRPSVQRQLAAAGARACLRPPRPARQRGAAARRSQTDCIVFTNPQEGIFPPEPLHTPDSSLLLSRVTTLRDRVGRRWLRALERAGALEPEHAARYGEALAAGLQAEEDYLAVHLARLDCLRRRGPAALPELRAAFQCAAPPAPTRPCPSARTPPHLPSLEQQPAHLIACGHRALRAARGRVAPTRAVCAARPARCGPARERPGGRSRADAPGAADGARGSGACAPGPPHH